MIVQENEPLFRLALVRLLFSSFMATRFRISENDSRDEISFGGELLIEMVHQ